MRFATEQDVDKLVSFLGQANMNGTGVQAIYPQFMLLEDEQGVIQATIGYEKVKGSGLLRSLVLSPHVDKRQFLQFFQSFLEHVKMNDVENLYLITGNRDSVPLFQPFGFHVVDKSRVLREITELEHFRISVQKPGALILNCQLLTKLSTD